MFQDNKKKAVHAKMGQVSRQEKGSPHKDGPGFKTTRKRQSTQRWARFEDNMGGNPHIDGPRSKDAQYI